MSVKSSDFKTFWVGFHPFRLEMMPKVFCPFDQKQKLMDAGLQQLLQVLSKASVKRLGLKNAGLSATEEGVGPSSPWAWLDFSWVMALRCRMTMRRP